MRHATDSDTLYHAHKTRKHHPRACVISDYHRGQGVLYDAAMLGE